jgi:NADP-dependent 3-hydroxy acid dehydrogenase YdfG
VSAELAPDRRTAIVTGASSGIGAATAAALAGLGFDVVAGARRLQRVEALTRRIAGRALALDVTDAESIERFAAAVAASTPAVDLLVNNAGLALGADRVEQVDDDDLRVMWETNVLGLLRVTRALLPLLRRAPHAHIVNIGSIAGAEVYPGGAGYASSKHAVRAITRILRLELNGEPIRVTEVAPGIVDTEFATVRTKGDAEAASAISRGIEPLRAGDIADVVAFAVSRPPHVDIDLVEIRPIAQATPYMIARRD